MKTKDELKALKDEYNTMMEKLTELTENEMEFVTGGKIDRSESGSKEGNLKEQVY